MNRATFRAFSPMSNTYEFIERPRRELWLIQGELISLSLHPLYRSSIISRFICSFVKVGVVTKHQKGLHHHGPRLEGYDRGTEVIALSSNRLPFARTFMRGFGRSKRSLREFLNCLAGEFVECFHVTTAPVSSRVML